MGDVVRLRKRKKVRKAVKEKEVGAVSSEGSPSAPLGARWGYTLSLWVSGVLGMLAFSEGRYVWMTIHVLFWAWALTAREQWDRYYRGPSPYELRRNGCACQPTTACSNTH